MQPEMTIGVGFTPRPWRTLMQRHVRDHVLGVALRVVREARMALEEHIDVLVVDDEAPFLTPMFSTALRERGLPIVGLYDPDDVRLGRRGIPAALRHRRRVSRHGADRGPGGDPVGPRRRG